MLVTKVKASSITNLTDARYFAAWGVDWMGFDLDPASESYIAPSQAYAIRDWVDGVQIVGQFGLQSAEDISKGVEYLKLDAVQVGRFSDLDELQSVGVPIFQEIVVESQTTPTELGILLEESQGKVAATILNFSKNKLYWKDLKQEYPFGLDYLKDLCHEHAILLHLDMNDQNILEILETLSLTGMVLKGGEEEKVGFKSFDELDAIFETIEEGE